MFTGIVEEIGSIRHVVSGAVSGEIEIGARQVLQGTKIGDSIAVNGVCLTVTSIRPNGFTADVMPETLRRSNLGLLKAGDAVDLERAMAADGRFGGHLVSGHIDGTGQIAQMRSEGNAVWVRILSSPEILSGIVEKGSIAIDGISLTVAALGTSYFEVSVIPHTGSETILLQKKPGDMVNLENDMIGKYVKHFLQPDANAKAEEGSLTMDFLAQHGFS